MGKGWDPIHKSCHQQGLVNTDLYQDMAQYRLWSRFNSEAFKLSVSLFIEFPLLFVDE